MGGSFLRKKGSVMSVKLKDINDSATRLPTRVEVERKPQPKPKHFLPFESPTDQAAQSQAMESVNRMTNSVSLHASDKGWRELDPSFLLRRRRWSLKSFVWFVPVFSVHGEGADPKRGVEGCTHSLAFTAERWYGPEGLREIVDYKEQATTRLNDRHVFVSFSIFLAVCVFVLSVIQVVIVHEGVDKWAWVQPQHSVLLFALIAVAVWRLGRLGVWDNCMLWSPMNGGVLPDDVKSDYIDILEMDGYRPLIVREAKNWDVTPSPYPVPLDPLLCAVHLESGRLFLVRHFDLTPVETDAMIKSITEFRQD